MAILRRRVPYMPPMDIAEVDDIPFDYTQDLRAGETIIGPTVEAVVLATGVAAPAVLSGSPVIGRIVAGEFTADPTGPIVIQRFLTEGVTKDYDIRCLAPLSSGRKLVAAGILPVVKL